MKPIYLYHLTQDRVIRYVGVTTNITVRKNDHKKNRPPHTFEIIDTFTDKEEAGLAEQYHIAGHNTFKNGWNKSIGGEMLLSGENSPLWKGGITLDMKAYKKAYHKTPERISYMKEYNAKPEVKARRRKYQQTPEAKAKAKALGIEYRKRPEVIARLKEYDTARYLRKSSATITCCQL